MAYEPYAEDGDYAVLVPYGPELSPGALSIASRHVDSLTFNRIRAAGFDSLTEFQQDVIREAVCRQAAFETENADLLASILSGYSVNGVSMQFGSGWNVVVENGVAMQRDVYALLAQTGLCCRAAG